MSINERLDALLLKLAVRKMAEPTKVIYRIQVNDKYTETDSQIEFSRMIRELVGGYNQTFKAPVAPEDIRVTLRSAPAEPEPPEWKTVE